MNPSPYINVLAAEDKVASGTSSDRSSSPERQDSNTLVIELRNLDNNKRKKSFLLTQRDDENSLLPGLNLKDFKDEKSASSITKKKE